MSKHFKQKQRIKNDVLVTNIIDKFGLTTETTEILLSRGISSIDTAERFLCPSLSHLIDPFLLSGMTQAVERINTAIDNGETIVIYGDYDADGLTSCALLTLCISQMGGTVAPFIPERKNGYGLQRINIEYLAEELCPDLIITTDCGISAADEISYIQNELGIDVIVTDHHEPPDILPDCCFINPKADAKYPFRELSGAGVAFKVATALVGIDNAKQYIDIAALGTLADCVPLIEENRVIAKFGIDEINKNRRHGIKALCNALKLNGSLTAGELIMKLIPKINAPGRIDEAQSVLDFFISKDMAALKTLADKLLRDNSTRQLVTEEILGDIYAEMKKECSYHKRILIFQGGWKDGIAGIAAARLKETFYRPAILFIETREGLYKGSGRSISGVDMYKMLSSLSDITEGFGGHAMACGVTVRPENFEEFKRRAEDYLAELPKELFIQTPLYDCKFSSQNITKIISELDKFEPCLPDDRPVFLGEGRFSARPFKSMSPHIKIMSNGLEVKAFYNYADFLPAINNNSINKQILFNLCIDNFSGKPSGILTDLKIFSDFDDSDPLIGKLFDNIDTDRLDGLSADREVFSVYYRYIKNTAKTANCYEDFYNAIYREDLSFRQFTASLIVFAELKLFDINFMPFFVRINNIKTDLANSPFYQSIVKYLQK